MNLSSGGGQGTRVYPKLVHVEANWYIKIPNKNLGYLMYKYTDSYVVIFHMTSGTAPRCMSQFSLAVKNHWSCT